MRNLILLPLLLIFLTSSCTSSKQAANSSTDITFIHTVFFWFNEGVSADEIKAFEASMADLAKVPLIAEAYYGPAANTPRDVVDNSYNFAWINHFKSKADHDAYQNDPTHLAMIESHKHLWKRVQVYDTIVKGRK